MNPHFCRLIILLKIEGRLREFRLIVLSAFRRALIASGIKLPKGQSEHVLRKPFRNEWWKYSNAAKNSGACLDQYDHEICPPVA